MLAQQVCDKDRRERDFLEGFHALRDTLIKPVFEEVGQLVKARGYEYRIESWDERRDEHGRAEGPQVEIGFPTVTDGLGDSKGQHPRFTVLAEVLRQGALQGEHHDAGAQRTLR